MIENKKIKILTIALENNRPLGEPASLEGQGFDIKFFSSSKKALASIPKLKPHLIIIDQGVSVIEMIRRLRYMKESAATPIMLVADTSNKEEIVEALNIGADALMIIPLDQEILAAKIKAVVRRSVRSKPLRKVSEDFVMDIKGYTVKIKGEDLPLTITEFKLLNRLLMLKGEAITREQLCTEILEKTYVVPRAIDVHVASLRKKLKTYSYIIKTVRGVGYKAVF